MFSKNYKQFSVIYNDNKYTFQDVLDITEQIEDVFNGRDLIILTAQNDLISLSVYLRSIISRTPVMLLSNDIDSSELEVIVGKFRPSYLISCKNSIVTFEEKHITRVLENYYLFEFKQFDPIKVFDKLALLLPTSGSTGTAKFVRISYQNIFNNTQSIIKFLKINCEDISITTLPMNYSFGLSIINTYVEMGACIVLTNKSIVERDFWSLISKHSITSISGVPYTFQLLKQLGFLRKSYPSLRTITQAGGALDLETKKVFLKYSKKNKIKFFVMYGQTEATARISYVPPSKLGTKLASIGKPVSGGRIKIDSNGQEGELIYHGKNVSLGYASNCLDLILGDEKNCILRTGDIGFKDSDGYFFITGRLSRFIKVNGIRIGLDDLEEMIERELVDIDVSCYGKDDSILIDYQSQNMTDENLKIFVSKKLKIHYRYITVSKVGEILRNKAGKKIYR
ncbi:AMP-binding protein [Candidatus Thioglobus sp.]|nr:AMP-binding protein [Candidatus Thioglobus sp.]